MTLGRENQHTVINVLSLQKYKTVLPYQNIPNKLKSSKKKKNSSQNEITVEMNP